MRPETILEKLNIRKIIYKLIYKLFLWSIRMKNFDEYAKDILKVELVLSDGEFAKEYLTEVSRLHNGFRENIIENLEKILIELKKK